MFPDTWGKKGDFGIEVPFKMDTQSKKMMKTRSEKKRSIN